MKSKDIAVVFGCLSMILLAVPCSIDKPAFAKPESNEETGKGSRKSHENEHTKKSKARVEKEKNDQKQENERAKKEKEPKQEKEREKAK